MNNSFKMMSSIELLIESSYMRYGTIRYSVEQFSYLGTLPQVLQALHLLDASQKIDLYIDDNTAYFEISAEWLKELSENRKRMIPLRWYAKIPELAISIVINRKTLYFMLGMYASLIVFLVFSVSGIVTLAALWLSAFVISLNVLYKKSTE